MIDFIPLGDRAWLARFVDDREARAWARAVRCLKLEGILDVVPAYRTVAVYADPDMIDLEDLEIRLRSLPLSEAEEARERLITLPVFYNGEDLDEVARWRGLSPREVIDLHTNREYTVLAIGFLPGFAYAGNLPEPLRGLARRESPRRKVPAGSVAIAGQQTGIYPAESPGGWHLLGQTPMRIADPDQGHFPIRVGDRLRFAPINAKEYAALQGTWLEHRAFPLEHP